MKSIVALTLVLGSVAVAGQQAQLSDRDVADAIAQGAKQKKQNHALRLSDSMSNLLGGLSALSSDSSSADPSTGFSAHVYSPIAWIRQQSADAAKEYRSIDPSDELREPVLRVIAYPDMPREVTARGVAGTSSVKHVVLRDKDRTIAIQPTWKESFPMEAANALGGRVEFTGLRAKFALDDVRELRGQNGREFYVTIIGDTGEEKNFEVKRKHFDNLP